MSDRSAKNYMDGPDRQVVTGEIDIIASKGGALKVDGEPVDLTNMGGDPGVGDLDDLETSEKATVVGAINELAVSVRKGVVALNGGNPTPVVFQGDTPGYLESGEGPFDCADPGNGGTFKIAVDGGGDKTATLNATAGTLTTGTSASQDISAETDNAIALSVDGDEFEDVVLDSLVGLNSGAAIAAALETAIQLLGGAKAAVTVAFSTNKYIITSGSLGTASKIRVQAPVAGSLLEELDMLDPEIADGEGDCADISAVTVDELVALLTGDFAEDVVVSKVGSKVRLTSETEGKDSSIAISNGTLNTNLGFTQGHIGYGAQGLGFEKDMADALYHVIPVLLDVASASLADKALSVKDKSASGFLLECETAAAADDVQLTIFGSPAAE